MLDESQNLQSWHNFEYCRSIKIDEVNKECSVIWVGYRDQTWWEFDRILKDHK